MPEGKLVRIAPSTMEKLGKLAKPFESPNECIERLLSESPCEKHHSEDQDESEESE